MIVADAHHGQALDQTSPSYEAFADGRLVDGDADSQLQALVARLATPVAA
ncbi:hypothetical protein DUHN55_15630 [Helicobacter pylori]